MGFRLFSIEEIIEIHEAVLNQGELEGMAGGKSLEGALSRIEFRLKFGMIDDVYDLAAMYAVAISQGHVFNDGNKRTAHAALEFCFIVHGIEMVFDTEETGDIIIKVAQGNMDETELAAWLRKKKLEC